MSGLYETPGEKWAKKNDEIYQKKDYSRDKEFLEEKAQRNRSIQKWLVRKTEGFWVLYVR